MHTAYVDHKCRSLEKSPMKMQDIRMQIVVYFALLNTLCSHCSHNNYFARLGLHQVDAADESFRGEF